MLRKSALEMMPRLFTAAKPRHESGKRPRFYLGTHRPNWLWKHPVSAYFVSDATLKGIKNLYPTTVPWALDSGGFTELAKHGRWTITPAEYAARVRRYASEVTHLEWAVPQDWMCGAPTLAATGLTVQGHQERTVDSVIEMRSRVPDTTIVPVLQGGEDVDDFRRHVDMYAARGFDLASEPRVAIGSVFRRQNDPALIALLHELGRAGLQVHALGFKKAGLINAGASLASADSMSWSLQGRYERHPVCVERDTHQHCGNCLRFALWWVEDMKREVPLDEGLGVVVRRPGLDRARLQVLAGAA